MPALLEVWRITAAGEPPRSLEKREVVEDVEALCRGAAHQASTNLSAADEDELLGHLFEQVVVLTRSYDPSRAGIVFRLWLYHELRRDAIDFLRSWLGRDGRKRVFDERLLLSGRGDDEWQTDPVDALEDERDSLYGGLVQLAAEVAVDGPEARTDAFIRFLVEGDRALPRQVGGLGLSEGAATPRGHSRAARPDDDLEEEAA